MFAAEKFRCPNKEDYVYFRFGGKLELQNEFDTLLIGSLENGKILNSKRYGQGFLGYGDHFGPMDFLNDGKYVYLSKMPKITKVTSIIIHLFCCCILRYDFRHSQ